MKGVLSESECGMVRVSRVFQKLLKYWDFHTQQSLEFTENHKKIKYPVSCICVEEWTDWLKMIERQQ